MKVFKFKFGGDMESFTGEYYLKSDVDSLKNYYEEFVQTQNREVNRLREEIERLNAEVKRLDTIICESNRPRGSRIDGSDSGDELS